MNKINHIEHHINYTVNTYETTGIFRILLSFVWLIASVLFSEVNKLSFHMVKNRT